MQRTNISKVSNSIVNDYSFLNPLIDQIRQGHDVRPSLKQMVDEVISPKIGNRIIRPCTPLMQIPDHKLLSPSDAMNDHMLLPTLSVKDVELN